MADGNGTKQSRKSNEKRERVVVPHGNPGHTGGHPVTRQPRGIDRFERIRTKAHLAGILHHQGAWNQP